MTTQEWVQAAVVGALAPLLWGANGLISKRLDKWRDAPNAKFVGVFFYQVGKFLGPLWPRSKKQFRKLLTSRRVG